MTSPVASWTVEYLFHSWDCDVQFAVGPFEDRTHADRVAEMTPSLRLVGADLVLHVAGRDYLVAPSTAIVHGDLPQDGNARRPAEFAFVNAWPLPSNRLATGLPYAREVARFWLHEGVRTYDRGGLREALLRYFRYARLERTSATTLLDVYESGGMRVDELLTEGWMVDAPSSLDAAAIRATTRLLTQWPALYADAFA